MTKIDHMEPISVSSYGPNSGDVHQPRQRLAVSVYVPQYILEAMLAAQAAVKDEN